MRCSLTSARSHQLVLLHTPDISQTTQEGHLGTHCLTSNTGISVTEIVLVYDPDTCRSMGQLATDELARCSSLGWRALLHQRVATVPQQELRHVTKDSAIIGQPFLLGVSCASRLWMALNFFP